MSLHRTPTLPGDRSALHVLVVDDSPAICNYVSEMLTVLGVGSVQTCDGPSQAMALLRRPDCRVNLVITDLSMPDTDGFQLIQALAGLKRPPAVLVMSSMDTRIASAAVTLCRDLKLQTLGRLRKPFTPADLSLLLDLWSPPTLPGALPTQDGTVNAARWNTAEICDAFDQGGLSLVFQPKVALADGRPVSCEALARLRTRDGRWIPPYEFIPALEASLRIDQFTDEVLRLAAEQRQIWSPDGLDLDIAVNLSALSLDDCLLPERVRRLLADYEGFSARLILELTESEISDEPLHLATMSRLRMCGVSLSIDDFGTGHSTLARVQRFPFTELKVDRMFVSGAADNSESRAILDSSAGLAHRLDMSVVAEGIETWEDWDTAVASGCDVGQGYLIGRPVPADQLADSLRDWQQRYQARFSAAARNGNRPMNDAQARQVGARA